MAQPFINGKNVTLKELKDYLYKGKKKEPVTVELDKKKLDYDINNDGKVDDKDVSLMAKKMGKISAQKRKLGGN